MCAAWNNNKIDLTILAKKLEEKRTNDPPNSFDASNGIVSDIFSVIQLSLKFEKEIPENERRIIVRKSIFAVAKKGVLTAKSIIGEVCKQENLYKQLPLKKYILATNLSLKFSDKLKRTKILNTTIVFSPRLPKAFDRESALKSAKRHKIIDQNESQWGITYVRVYVKARTEHEAFTGAIDALDFLRGIWNFYFNHSVGRRMSSGVKQPVNEIKLGQIHTLHLPTGKMATETYWYEFNNFSSAQMLSVEDNWNQLYKFEKTVRYKVTKHRYRSEITDAILKYTRALDHNDLNNAFLSLWTLLENLTASVASYDEAIRRTLFLFRDREFHKQLLEHLRDYRNKTTHSGHLTDEIEALV